MKFIAIKFSLLMFLLSSAVSNAQNTKRSNQSEDFLFKLLPVQREEDHSIATVPAKKDESGAAVQETCLVELKEAKTRIERISGMLSSVLQYAGTRYFVDVCSIGLHDYRIPDSNITASSAHPSYPARFARLNKIGNSWRPSTTSTGQYVQIHLAKPRTVTGVVTQGMENINYWTRSYQVSYSNTTSGFTYVGDILGNPMIFEGNSDRNGYVLNRFPQPVTASIFRLTARSHVGYSALRLELITC